ncbi:hypothetical protein [Natrialba magadii]
MSSSSAYFSPLAQFGFHECLEHLDLAEWEIDFRACLWEGSCRE